MASRQLFTGCENKWDSGEKIIGLSPEHYTVYAAKIEIKHTAPPGVYRTNRGQVEIIKQYVLKATMSVFGGSHYDPIKSWLTKYWPAAVGRYSYEGTIIDVIFGEEECDQDSSHLRRCEHSPLWTDKEKHEWTMGEYGIWNEWAYDLKSPIIASVAMQLISGIPPEERTPHRIVRHFTSLANEANSEHGLVYGQWDPAKFKEGKHPSYWRRSSHILEAYLLTGLPVKFGQCWIFAEVLISLFRYVGIPARSLYIENARVDKGRDCGVDLGFAKSKSDGEYYEYEGVDVSPLLKISSKDMGTLELDPDKQDIIEPAKVVSKCGDAPMTSPIDCNFRDIVASGDDLWNFHLFAEAFIARPDLQSHTAPGWNCVDASPLNVTYSKDEYKDMKVLGPCPAESILYGTNTDHDSGYFTSSINGLYRFWKEQSITDKKGRVVTIMYPSNIVYGCLTQTNDKRQARVYIRDPQRSVGPRIIIRQDISAEYKPDPEDAYAIHHRDHPFTISWDVAPPEPSMKLRVTTLNALANPSVIQVCYLDNKDRIITCDRQIIKSIEDYKFPAIPIITVKVSVVVVDSVTSKWWAITT